MHQIAETVLPGEMIFDIGANVGAKAAWYSDRQARVIAVEPQPAMVAELRRKFEGNALVTIVPKGVGAKVGSLTMSINSVEPVLSTFSEQWKEGRFSQSTWDERVDVEMTTLDDLVAEYGKPRYTKIDVEGFEHEVVSGLSSKIGALSFEFTAEYINEVIRICDHLQSIGYSYFNASIGENDAFY